MNRTGTVYPQPIKKIKKRALTQANVSQASCIGYKSREEFLKNAKLTETRARIKVVLFRCNMEEGIFLHEHGGAP